MTIDSQALFVGSMTDVVLYVNPIKIAVVAILTVVWAIGVQWVDRDTNVVKTKREQWNFIVISGALVGYFVMFAVPFWQGSLFSLGLAFWVLIAGGTMGAYVVHRNGRVKPAARMLTKAHFKRLFGSDPSKRKEVKDKGIRIHLSDHKGEAVTLPEDADQALDFQASEEFLHDILWRRASDVDLLVGKEKYRMVCKIDGVAIESPEGLSSDRGERVFRFLKTVAGLDVEERRRPQTGQIKVALLSQSGEIGPTEIRSSGTTAGERLRIHIQTGPVLMRLHELGIASQRLEGLKKNVLGKSTGMCVIASPKQNGLTTSQYAIVRSHDAFMHNIHALERRGLLDLDNITQVLFEGANTDVNYARMLQTVLRREPDIVLVSECEDKETAQIATRAAATDRKIYMGMHATDCFDALAKYLKLVDDNAMAAKALRGILAQRLVRVLCEQCREAFKPDADTLKKLNIPADKIERFYRPPSEPKLDRKGKEILCPHCQGTGYGGRTGIFELMVVDETIAKMIAEGATINRIKAQCRKGRMHYLQEEGLLKVIDGTTSMNEILRCLRTNGK
ncbi:MAG: Flp pilus assembly complex ATPase component TadA [Planctomycetes bacterium]|nr:Flp pilus assembly complex ATPase component TadA [Planctomycetota bacterium]